jgi:DNA-3-methyladenine glycosylase I
MTEQADDGRVRCAWALSDPLLRVYHDEEWGVPVHDDRAMYERLMLEGFQAGLSWLTVLRKRAALERAFAGWDPETVARFGEAEIAAALADPGIIRNRAKVNAAVTNARAMIRLRDAGTGLSDHLWSFVDGTPLVRRPATPADVPAFTPEAAAMSKDLKKRGFTFVGPTICYALMQSAGLVDDHLAGCFLAQESG